MLQVLIIVNISIFSTYFGRSSSEVFDNRHENMDRKVIVFSYSQSIVSKKFVKFISKIQTSQYRQRH